MGKPDLANKLAEDDGVTTRIKVLAARAILDEATEGTTVLHRYQPKAPRVGWARRLLNWFRRG